MREDIDDRTTKSLSFRHMNMEGLCVCQDWIVIKIANYTTRRKLVISILPLCQMRNLLLFSCILPFSTENSSTSVRSSLVVGSSTPPHPILSSSKVNNRPNVHICPIEITSNYLTVINQLHQLWCFLQVEIRQQLYLKITYQLKKSNSKIANNRRIMRTYFLALPVERFASC